MKKRVAILLCGYVGILGTQQIPLSFDLPHKASWFQKASDMCIKAWGDLQQIQYNSLSPSEYVLIAECTLGRLIYARWCLQHMHQARTYISAEDQAHFLHICDILTVLWNQHAHSLGSEYTICFQQLMHNCVSFFTVTQ